MCLSVCRQIDGYRRGHVPNGRPLWRDPPPYDILKARLVFPSNFYPESAIMIVVSPVGAAEEGHAESCEDSQRRFDSSKNAVFVSLFPLYTLGGDTARWHGVNVVNPLSENNRSGKSMSRCRLWLRECLFSVETEDCLHEYDEEVHNTVIKMRPSTWWDADLANYFQCKSSSHLFASKRTLKSQPD